MGRGQISEWATISEEVEGCAGRRIDLLPMPRGYVGVLAAALLANTVKTADRC